MNKSFLLTLAVFMLGGAGAFWAGMVYRGALDATPSTGTAQFAGPTSSPSGVKPPTTAHGQVVSKQSSGFVIKAPDGSTKTVSYTSTTSVTVMTMSTEPPEKISVGDNVFVIGSPASSDGVAAQSIQITHGLPTAPGQTPALGQ